MESENSKEAVLKAKYSELSRDFDVSKKEHEVTEKLLCRAIIRLTLAANGLDPALDPYLKKLRKLLKFGVKNNQLREQVDIVSEALLRAEEGDEAVEASFDASVLFNFLDYCAEGAEKEAIKTLSNDYTNNKYTDSGSLFNAISNALKPVEVKSAPKPGLLGRLFGRGKKKEAGELFGAVEKAEFLSRLLDSLDVPAYLNSQLQVLKQQAVSSNDDTSLFFKVLEDTIALLLLIKSRVKKDQQEIEAFLSGVVVQIETIGSASEGMRSLVCEADEAREKLALCVSSNVSELNQENKQATSLDGLKRSVESRLETLSFQVQEHLASDKRRVEEAKEKLEEMALALQEMEAEAAGLKSTIILNNDLAYRDSLTGLPNRLAYDERITHDLARWNRDKEPLTLLVWDIDHFKDINDRFGHQAGDVALRKIAEVLSSQIRETDFVGRYGGEEFVMLLPKASKEVALSKANAIRKKIKECGLNSKGKPITVTASCGLAQLIEGDVSSSVFERADKALYQAKSDGRNRCIFSE